MKRIALIFPHLTASAPTMPAKNYTTYFAAEVKKFTDNSPEQLDSAVWDDLQYLSHCLNTTAGLRAQPGIPSLSFVCGFGGGEIAALTFTGYLTLEQAIQVISRKEHIRFYKSAANARVFSPLLGRLVEGAEDVDVITSTFKKSLPDEHTAAQWLERKGVRIMLSVGEGRDLPNTVQTENMGMRYFDLTKNGVADCTAYLATNPEHYLSVVSECMATMAATPNINASADKRIMEAFAECRVLLGKNNEVNATATGLLRSSLLAKGYSAEMAETCVQKVLLDTGVHCLN